MRRKEFLFSWIPSTAESSLPLDPPQQAAISFSIINLSPTCTK